jgi:hypothetical protein
MSILSNGWQWLRQIDLPAMAGTCANHKQRWHASKMDVDEREVWAEAGALCRQVTIAVTPV